MIQSAKDIRKARKLVEWSQTELGHAVGLSQPAIAKIEKGKNYNIPYDTFIRIRDALNKKNVENGNVLTLKDVMVPVITLPPNAPIETANKIMHEKSISQIPIVEGGKTIGTVSSNSLAGAVLGSHTRIKTVSQAMVLELPQMNEETPISIISQTLNQFHAILATRSGEIVGIVTSEDVLMKALKDH